MDGADCTDGVRNVFRNAIFDILLILEGFFFSRYKKVDIQW